MRKLRIGIIDLVPQGPATSLWARVMNANMASVMPQVLAVWCERRGHDVHYTCYTGFEDLFAVLPEDRDLWFVSSFTRSAQLAYAVGNLCRSRGAVTVLGGPHARCFPDDARRHFDYVLGLTDQALVESVLAEAAPHRPLGVHLTARQQPDDLPGVEDRWKFIEATLDRAPVVKIVPVVGSLGCPYTCDFCIDAPLAYRQMDLGRLRDDLRFLRARMRRPRVGWQDPNFGVRFDECLAAIDEAVPPGSIDHIAEMSLALLSEPRLERLRRTGFRALLPGIESWYETGNKSRTGVRTGEAKMRQVADHVNLMLRYVPYVQVNFILGLDSDAGAEPFELTKRFLDRVPAAFPAYSLLTAFGEAAPLNLELQRAGRVLGFPFHFLDNNKAMNVRPLHYGWTEFYDRVVDLTEHSFSWRAIRRRLAAQGPGLAGGMNLVRAVSSEGFGRIRYHRQMRERLDRDRAVRAFHEGETTEIPGYYRDAVRRKLGPLWSWLPEGGLDYDPIAYLRKHEAAGAAAVPLRAGAAGG